MSSRAWTITLNNYTAEEYDNLIALPCKFLIVGKEVGESGTPHLQGFIRFSSTKRLTGVKKLIPRAHLEKALGTDAQNITYCSKEYVDKDGNLIDNAQQPFMVGTPSSQGKRTDLAKVVTDIEKHGLMEAALDNPETFIKFHRGFQAYANVLIEKESKPIPTVLWYWGSTGTGKTREAYSLYPDAWFSGENLKWFDGYTGQSAVIIDDFRGDFCTFHWLLRILDRYPIRVPIKGGFVNWIPKVIIITAPHPPSRIYTTVEDIAQLTRRITTIKEFTSSI